MVQLYFSDLYASMVRPEKELAGFKRLFLKKGETKTVQFEFDPTIFAFINSEMEWIVEKGSIALLIGKSSAEICLQDTISINETWKIDQRTRCFFAEATVNPI